ncbi:MAG: hypothetical protein R3E79_12140 [Caldilineaceae bacterium]
MSISPVVDETYRLHPQDLGRSRVPVTIQNVSWQGIEQLQPLLHLREFPQKRLLLTAQQVQTIIAVANSIRERDWIGHTILLLVEDKDDEPIITLTPLTAAAGRAPQVYPRIPLPEWGRTGLLLLLLVLIFVLVFLLENFDILWSGF